MGIDDKFPSDTLVEVGIALGRGIQLSDEPLLDEMQKRLATNDFRFSAAVETIVQWKTVH